MKTALVAIAKDEDRYIDEWLKYNFKLGFDTIILYKNNWNVKLNGYENLIQIQADNDNPYLQSIVYNDAIKKFQNDYDWIAFFDIDEFLTIKSGTLEQFLQRYQQYDAIGVNWKIFGDSGLEEPNRDYSVLGRFTKCQVGLNEHIKTIINSKKVKNNFIYICCHCTEKSLTEDSTINTAQKSFIHGPKNTKDVQECECCAYLNHYRNKTKPECFEKCVRNENGVYSKLVYLKTFDEDFERFNRNEMEDRTALNFYNGENNENSISCNS